MSELERQLTEIHEEEGIERGSKFARLLSELSIRRTIDLLESGAIHPLLISIDWDAVFAISPQLGKRLYKAWMKATRESFLPERRRKVFAANVVRELLSLPRRASSIAHQHNLPDAEKEAKVLEHVIHFAQDWVRANRPIPKTTLRNALENLLSVLSKSDLTDSSTITSLFLKAVEECESDEILPSDVWEKASAAVDMLLKHPIPTFDYYVSHYALVVLSNILSQGARRGAEREETPPPEAQAKTLLTKSILESLQKKYRLLLKAQRGSQSPREIVTYYHEIRQTPHLHTPISAAMAILKALVGLWYTTVKGLTPWAKHIRIPVVYLVGSRGVGKTSIVEEIAREAGLPWVTLTASALRSDDIQIPVTIHHTWDSLVLTATTAAKNLSKILHAIAEVSTEENEQRVAREMKTALDKIVEYMERQTHPTAQEMLNEILQELSYFAARVTTNKTLLEKVVQHEEAPTKGTDSLVASMNAYITSLIHYARTQTTELMFQLTGRLGEMATLGTPFILFVDEVGYNPTVVQTFLSAVTHGTFSDIKLPPFFMVIATNTPEEEAGVPVPPFLARCTILYVVSPPEEVGKYMDERNLEIVKTTLRTNIQDLRDAIAGNAVWGQGIAITLSDDQKEALISRLDGAERTLEREGGIQQALEVIQAVINELRRIGREALGREVDDAQLFSNTFHLIFHSLLKLEAQVGSALQKAIRREREELPYLDLLKNLEQIRRAPQEGEIVEKKLTVSQFFNSLALPLVELCDEIAARLEREKQSPFVEEWKAYQERGAPLTQLGIAPVPRTIADYLVSTFIAFLKYALFNTVHEVVLKKTGVGVEQEPVKVSPQEVYSALHRWLSILRTAVVDATQVRNLPPTGRGLFSALVGLMGASPEARRFLQELIDEIIARYLSPREGDSKTQEFLNSLLSHAIQLYAWGTERNVSLPEERRPLQLKEFIEGKVAEGIRQLIKDPQRIVAYLLENFGDSAKTQNYWNRLSEALNAIAEGIKKATETMKAPEAGGERKTRGTTGGTLAATISLADLPEVQKQFEERERARDYVGLLVLGSAVVGHLAALQAGGRRLQTAQVTDATFRALQDKCVEIANELLTSFVNAVTAKITENPREEESATLAFAFTNFLNFLQELHRGIGGMSPLATEIDLQQVTKHWATYLYCVGLATWVGEGLRVETKEEVSPATNLNSANRLMRWQGLLLLTKVLQTFPDFQEAVERYGSGFETEPLKAFIQQKLPSLRENPYLAISACLLYINERSNWRVGGQSIPTPSDINLDAVKDRYNFNLATHLTVLNPNLHKDVLPLLMQARGERTKQSPQQEAIARNTIKALVLLGYAILPLTLTTGAEEQILSAWAEGAQKSFGEEMDTLLGLGAGTAFLSLEELRKFGGNLSAALELENALPLFVYAASVNIVEGKVSEAEVREAGLSKDALVREVYEALLSEVSAIAKAPTAKPTDAAIAEVFGGDWGAARKWALAIRERLMGSRLWVLAEGVLEEVRRRYKPMVEREELPEQPPLPFGFEEGKGHEEAREGIEKLLKSLVLRYLRRREHLRN